MTTDTQLKALKEWVRAELDAALRRDDAGPEMVHARLDAREAERNLNTAFGFATDCDGDPVLMLTERGEKMPPVPMPPVEEYAPEFQANPQEARRWRAELYNTHPATWGLIDQDGTWYVDPYTGLVWKVNRADVARAQARKLKREAMKRDD